MKTSSRRSVEIGSNNFAGGDSNIGAAAIRETS